MELNEWPFFDFTGKPRRSVLKLNPRNFKSHHLWECDNLHALTAQVTGWKRNKRSKSKCSTFPQRNITSQGHKKQILKKIVCLILKISKNKGMMMLARLRYNSLCMYKDLSAKRAQSTNLVKNSWSTHALHSPPLPFFNVEIWFQSYVAKVTLQKGGKTTWSIITSALRSLNEFMGLRYMYLVRRYFALSSLHLLRNSSISFTQKGVRIIYCESSIIPLPFYAPIN